MGLHLDIDRIFVDNYLRPNVVRKYGCVIINQGGKLTAAEKHKLQQFNHQKYGLSQEYVDYLALPPSSDIQVYDV